MAKLEGNIADLVKDAAKEDKRSQLITPVVTKEKGNAKPGQRNLRIYDEEYVRVRLLLPKSMNREIDRYFFNLNTK